MNIPSIIIALLIAGAFVGIIASAVKSKKNGKSILCSCSGSCNCSEGCRCGGSCGCNDCHCSLPPK